MSATFLEKAKILPRVAVVGGGPAGLMRAEALSEGRAQVDVFDSMPSVGRKFLLAGKGGLNLTHSEAFEPFLARYGERREMIAPLLGAFGPDTLIAWARTLGFGLGALAWLVGQEMLAERA